ncbi:MAG: hypothetical protein EPN76_10685 [Burkholderiaceae bacterium]|nr:MAG: hypothetical protein EPN76_10685 [Burkholderiaceae bacterium]
MQAESADGTIISCNYRHHPRFSTDCKLSAGLHYVFIRFASERSYSKVYELRTAIRLFLDYAVEYESQNPKVLHHTSFLQISAEVFYGYDLFIKRNRGPKGLATRLKSALIVIAKNHNEGLPLLALPALDHQKYKSFEPLTEACFNQVTSALKVHIDLLYEKIDFRRVVDLAKPHSCEEVLAHENGLHTWTPEIDRSLKTLIVNAHPFVVTHEEFVETYRKGKRPAGTVLTLTPLDRGSMIKIASLTEAQPSCLIPLAPSLTVI